MRHSHAPLFTATAIAGLVLVAPLGNPLARIPEPPIPDGASPTQPETAPLQESKLDQYPHKPMSNNTLLFALYRMGYRGRMTGHGFRGVASIEPMNETWSCSRQSSWRTGLGAPRAAATIHR